MKWYVRCTPCGKTVCIGDQIGLLPKQMYSSLKRYHIDCGHHKQLLEAVRARVSLETQIKYSVDKPTRKRQRTAALPVQQRVAMQVPQPVERDQAEVLEDALADDFEEEGLIKTSQ